MALVPTPPTFGGNAVASSSQENQIRDALNFLEKPPLCMAIQIVAQSIPNVTNTTLTFTSHVIDQDYLGGTMHSDSVNTSRLTANFAGWYWVGGGIGFSPNATGTRYGELQVNGTQVAGSGVEVPTVTGGGQECVLALRGMPVFLNVGDYLELVALQSSGGALNTSISNGAKSTLCVKFVSI